MSDKSCPKILVADDDDDVLEMFGEVFKELDNKIELTLFNDGNKLFSVLEKSEILPRLIVLDINMNQCNGIELLKKIKATEKIKNISVVMFSSSRDNLEVKSCYENGASCFVRKPDNYTELLEVINSIYTYYIIEKKSRKLNSQKNIN